MDALQQYGLLGLKCVGGLLALSFVAFPLGAMLQERKNFRDVGLGLYGHLNAFCFIQFWMAFSGCCFLVQVPAIIMGKKDVAHVSNTYYEHLIGTWGFKLFLGRAELRGLQHLPAAGSKPCVYVFNHQSMIDICVLYFLRQRFAWVSKKSVTFLPGVGQIMWLSGHVLLDRGGRESVKQMFRLCKERLNGGTSIFIFPQGTRERSKTLPFKHGAFSLAVGGGEGVDEYDIVPVSINVCPTAWRMNMFGSGFIGGGQEKPAATLTVHPRIVTANFTKGVDKTDKKQLDEVLGKLNKAAFDAIYSVLEIKNPVVAPTSSSKKD